MKAARTLVALLLVLLTFAGSATAGQQHVVSPHQLTEAMTGKLDADQADRASVHEALARPEVRGVAARMGIDLDQANAAVDTMQGADLERAASTARQLNQEFVGGASTVTISTTTIIIILLAIILIVIIAK